MISIVIPVYNERESLATPFDEITATASTHALAFEVVFVDDGSTDDSWDVIAGLSRQHAHVHGVRFRRNFGKAAALSAGFRAAKGDVVLTLDADLQDDPKEIPRFLAALEHGTTTGADGKVGPALASGGKRLDVVSGWKRVRHDPWHK